MSQNQRFGLVLFVYAVNFQSLCFALDLHNGILIFGIFALVGVLLWLDNDADK